MNITKKVIELTRENSNNMKLGSSVRELVESLNIKDEKPTYVYESPDGGNTIYRRESGSDERELVKKGEDVWPFKV